MTITKFTHGAWLVFVLMPILFVLMLGVNRYYRDVEKEVEVDPTTTFGATGDHAIVLVGKMQKPILKALDYAIAAKHDSLEAVHMSIDPEATKLLEQQWIETEHPRSARHPRVAVPRVRDAARRSTSRRTVQSTAPRS